MRPNINVPSDIIAILGDTERNKTFIATFKSLVEYEHLLCGSRYDWVVWVREPTPEQCGVILPMIYTRHPTRPTDVRRLEDLDGVAGLIASNPS